MDVKLPNGRIVKNVPDGTSQDVLRQKVIAAGLITEEDFPAPVEFSDAQQDAARAQAFKDLASDVGPGESFLIGAGRGLTTIARGLGIADPEDPAVTQSIAALKEENPISTIGGEIAGEAAPFLLPGGAVAKIATIPGRVAASTVLGAAEAGLITKGLGGDASETVTSGGLGGVVAGTLEVALPVIGRIGGKLIRRVLGKSPSSPVLNAAGEPSSEFLEAMDKAGLSLDDVTADARRTLETEGIDDPAALLRKSFLEEQGIIPTRAQITGDVTEFQRQQELFKTSGRVRRAIEGQEVALSRGFDNAITTTGGSASKSNSPVFDVIADRSIAQDAAISQAYKQSREIASDQKIIKPENLIKSLKSIAGSDSATGGLASATRDILKSKGLLQKGKLKVVGSVDATVAEQIRIDMNALFNSLTPFGKGKLREFKSALDDDVAAAVGEDVFAEARSAKAKFETDLSRAKVNKFDNRKKNLVRDILENKINPDRFLDDAVLSKTIRSADLDQLKTFMQTDEVGQAAWNDLRAEAMQRIKDTAFSEVGGDIAVSRANMERALNKFGEQKLNILFSPDENKFLRDMLTVTKLREPKRGTALGKGPSAQAISKLEEAIKRIPIVQQAFEGVGTFFAGGRALSSPDLSPLKPSNLTSGTPALIPLLTEEEE